MGQKGVPTPLVLVVDTGSDLNTTGQAVSALRRLASNGDNAVGMVRVSCETLEQITTIPFPPFFLNSSQGFLAASSSYSVRMSPCPPCHGFAPRQIEHTEPREGCDLFAFLRPTTTSFTPRTALFEQDGVLDALRHVCEEVGCVENQREAAWRRATRRSRSCSCARASM